MQMNRKRRDAFTLVEIMIVVSLVGLLAAIAVPNSLRAHATSQQNTCIENLRLIDNAKQQWALEYRLSGGVIPNAANIAPYLNRSGSTSNIICPADPGHGKKQKRSFDTSYKLNAVSNPPTCNILPESHSLP